MSMRTPPNICKMMVFLILFVTTMWGSPKEKILHSFANNPRGENPYGSLVFDLSGNLYGATANGGQNRQGLSLNWRCRQTGIGVRTYSAASMVLLAGAAPSLAW